MESKIELTDRLRREKRWAEASAWKDTEVKRLRSEGLARGDAADKAWQAMAEKFPPVGRADSFPSNGDGHAPDDADFAQLADGDDASPDLIRDIRWAYNRLDARNAKPVDAPSCGAWALLTWARANPGAFFEKLLPKAMPARPVVDPEEEARERRLDADRQCAMIDKIIEANRAAERERMIKKLEECRDRAIEECRLDDLEDEAIVRAHGRTLGLSETAITRCLASMNREDETFAREPGDVE